MVRTPPEDINLSRMSLRYISSESPKDIINFSEFIGTEYEQVSGAIIGNIYTERGVDNGKEFTVSEIYDIYIGD